MLTYSGLGVGGRGLIWAVITNLCGPSQGGSGGNESACHAGDTSSTPESGRSPGRGMVTHSSILVWGIPRTEERFGLQSIRSQRVRHDSADTTDWAHTRSLVYVLAHTLYTGLSIFWQESEPDVKTANRFTEKWGNRGNGKVWNFWKCAEINSNWYQECRGVFSCSLGMRAIRQEELGPWNQSVLQEEQESGQTVKRTARRRVGDQLSCQEAVCGNSASKMVWLHAVDTGGGRM